MKFHVSEVENIVETHFTQSKNIDDLLLLKHSCIQIA